MRRFLLFAFLLTSGFFLKAPTDKEKVWELIEKLDHLLILKDSASGQGTQVNLALRPH
jgi:hypothetical protein